MQSAPQPSPRPVSRGTTAVLAIGLLFTGTLWLGARSPALAEGSNDDSLQPPPGWKLEGDAERARPTFAKFCSNCHGEAGKGDGVMAKFLDTSPKDLTDSEYMSKRSDYEIYLVIQKGGAEVGLSDKMAPWEQLLDDQQIRDLALLVRELGRGK